MGITEILGLLGGLALFLYGMQMMSGGLEDIAGNSMKKILQKLTANRFLGVGVGAGITALVQSSSATTVMTVGFVNSNMMTLKQAVWIIMGANIGTTITGQLIALDVGMLAPLFAFIGVAMVVFLKKPKVKHIGIILAGLGVLFIGMNMMGDAMKPLRDSQTFIAMMSKFSNPLLGILAGALVTAIIQSSSASIGILQALALAGAIDFRMAVFVLFGQNIGTCITAVLAAVGTNRAAKRTTIIHLIFNMIGTTAFTTACMLLPVTDWVGAITPGDPAKQIANMHTIFNITTTLILLPFGGLLAEAAEKLLPDSKEKDASAFSALGEEFRQRNFSLGAIAANTNMLKKEILRMLRLTAENTGSAYNAILTGDIASLEKINETEESIDLLNKDISQFISKILVYNQSSQNISDIEQYFLITGNVERIGDHAVNIAGYTKVVDNQNIVFSEGAKQELIQMRALVLGTLEKLMHIEDEKTQWLSDIAAAEQKIDDMTVVYRERHLERMRNGECSEEACVLYSELLTDFERIGDHALNIGQALAKINDTY